MDTNVLSHLSESEAEELVQLILKAFRVMRILRVLERPYARVLIPEEDGGYFAYIEEFEGCTAQGDSADLALLNLQDAAVLWIERMAQTGQPIPKPTRRYRGREGQGLPASTGLPKTDVRQLAAADLIDRLTAANWPETRDDHVAEEVLAFVRSVAGRA
mgnify:CR=1 FL=1